MANIITYPNQKIVNIHRESAKSDFLGIKNENWQTAARDLGAHAIMLYLYLAANADGFNLALSPAAVSQAIGMPRSTYHDQFKKLVDRGYIVQGCGNSFNFFEKPQTSNGIQQETKKNQSPTDVLNFEKCPLDVSCDDQAVPNVLTEDIEINNTENSITNQRTNNNDYVLTQGGVYIPKVKEIKIPVPKVERKKQITPLPSKKEFTF